MSGRARSRRGLRLLLVVSAVVGVAATLSHGQPGTAPALRARAASGSVVFVPAAAHATGANGASWRTDLEVHNPSGATASFTVQLLRRDAVNASPASRSYTLGAQKSRRFVDVLVSEFGTEGAAALRIEVASGALVVTSRTYNLVGANPWQLPQGASFGQYVPGWDESDAIAYGEEGRLVHLTQQVSSSLDGFRTNLGLVNATASPVDVRVDLYRADGTWLGKKDGGETSLPAYGFRQLNEVFGAFGTVADGWAAVRTTTPGGRILAFATVIDNHNSGDPVFIPAARVTSATGPTPTPGPTATPTPAPTATPTPPAGLRPNLVLHRPEGWPACVVVHSFAGCCTSSACCSPTASTTGSSFVQFVVANTGTAAATGTVLFSMTVDGVAAGTASWPNSSGLEPGFGVVLTWEFKGAVAPGVHDVTLAIDPANAIAESNEADNACTTTVIWGGAPLLVAALGEMAPAQDALTGDAPAPIPGNGARRALEPSAGPIYVPASAHASGVNGASWRTDLEVHNPGTTAVTFGVALLKQGSDNSGTPETRSFSLGPQQSVRYVDALASLFGFTGAASLRITSQPGPILVNSRTYNLIGPNSVGLPVGASFGQFVPGLPESEAIGYGEEGRIIQLTHRDASTLADFRTNVGFVNTTGSPIDLRIDLFTAEGVLLGTIQDAATHLRPWEFAQVNGIFGRFTDRLEDGYAVVRTLTPGGRFFAFATVIDNHLTGDPIFIPAARMAGSPLPTPTPTPTPTPAAVSVVVHPSAVTLVPGGRQAFRATVTGTPTVAVTWKVAEGPGGGTVDAQGGYTAPSAPGLYRLVATSQADPAASGSAFVLVSATPTDPVYAPKTTVTGTTTAETKSVTTSPNAATVVSLADGTSVDIPALPTALTVTLTRETNTLASVRAAGQETSGAMRTLTITGDSASLDFVPKITIPAAQAGALTALNVARVGPLAQGGELMTDRVTFLPAVRDASGNVFARDVHFRGAARLAPASSGPAALGVVKTVRTVWTLSTYQGQLNWAIEPQLIRMVPDAASPAKRKPLSSLPKAQQEEILRRPVQNAIVLVHGHNEIERYGFEPPEIDAPWLVEYKRDVWTLLYETFGASYAAYDGCTAFYEYVYPTYRPVFDGSGEKLGASLARLVAEDPRLKKMTARYNLFFVAHSMGGLVARSAINQLPAAAAPSFTRLVTWGSPHRGSPVVTMRYLLTSGYNLDVPGMCVTGSWLPLEALNHFALYKGIVGWMGAVDTPGERELRWDNAQPLNLAGIGWKRAYWQEGDDVRWDPARNPDLYNDKLLEFNRSDKYYLSDKYVALYGLTSKIAAVDVTSCTALRSFKNADAIAQGNGINHWLYNNPATVGSAYPGNPAVKESDGAVPVDSMVGAGIFSPFSTYTLGDTDHEEYYGAPKAGALTARDKGESTAHWTLERLKLQTEPDKKCDCPTLTVSKAQESGTTAQVTATLKWPGDASPGQRVKGLSAARGEGAGRAVAQALSFTAKDDGSITGSFDAAALKPRSAGEKVYLLAIAKDDAEVAGVLVLEQQAPGNSLIDVEVSVPVGPACGRYPAPGVETKLITLYGSWSGDTLTASWSGNGIDNGWQWQAEKTATATVSTDRQKLLTVTISDRSSAVTTTPRVDCIPAGCRTESTFTATATNVPTSGWDSERYKFRAAGATAFGMLGAFTMRESSTGNVDYYGDGGVHNVECSYSLDASRAAETVIDVKLGLPK